MSYRTTGVLEGHLLQHCSHSLPQDGMYCCQVARCSGRFHQSLSGLKAHIELSHMSRMSLPCPIRGCDEAFVRASLLENHLEEVHRKDLADSVSADAIAPLAKPSIPSSLPPPPSLSHSCLPQHITVASVVPSKRRASQMGLNGTNRLPRRWSRLDLQDDDQDHETITFDDLPRLQLSKSSNEPIPVKVRKKLHTAQTRVSRPQRAVYPPIRTDDVPDTILFGTFARRVEQFVADGFAKK
ncbi:hypothetical protein J3A83DRAFT_1418811 [Scleroderma citrinum]